MDTTIRNLDERLYRELKARAAGAGRTMGYVLLEVVTVLLVRRDHGAAQRVGTVEVGGVARYRLV